MRGGFVFGDGLFGDVLENSKLTNQSDPITKLRGIYP